jgi:hypothetical protein
MGLVVVHTPRNPYDAYVRSLDRAYLTRPQT